ncbi:MAG: hypothetical protein GXO74_11775 [Calditrichaeota bacterium]|nr:hypothetical protein [Calditrichota bacterium]
MMDAYLENTIAGFFRALILLFLLFVALPKLLLGREKLSHGSDNIFAGFILTSSFVIVAVFFLSIIRIYDSISLYLGVGLFSAIFVLTGDYGKGGNLLTRFNYNGLKFLERDASDWLRRLIFRKRRRQNARQEPYAFVWNIMLAIVMIVAAGMRLIPVVRTASPFSVEAYKTLEYVKSLGTKSLFYDQMFVPKGLHAIIDVVFQFSRVNPQTLVHIFGAVTALILMIAIHHVVFRVTANRPSALLAAAIFGVFSRLLPVSLEQQVEANSIVLASLFLILSLSFTIDFVSSPSLFFGVAAFLGVMVSVLVSYFSAVIFILFVPVISLCAMFAPNSHGKNGRRRFLSGAIFALSVAGIYLLYWQLAANPMFVGIVKNIVTDDLFMRFAREEMVLSKNIFFYVSLGLGISSMLLFLKMKTSLWRAHYFVWGLMTVILAVFWYGENLEIPIDLNRAQVGFVLSLFVCISLGLVVYGLLFRFLQKRVGRENVTPLRVTVWGLVVILIFFEIFLFLKAPTIARFQYQTEPDGYVRAIYEIEKKYDPFEWMVVSHFGSKVEVQNYGKYMDYLYFLKYYNPRSFNEKSGSVIPASHLFIFIEKDKTQNHVDTALLPKIPDLNDRLQKWCAEFAKRNNNIHVFYEDEQVQVYQIDIPKKKKTISDQLS